MTDAPDALLKLWAERDDRVLLAYKDGDEPGAVRSVLPDPAASETNRQPFIPENRPVRTVTPYPTYKITPQPVDPATYHVRKPQ